jgi:hypothetical protein
MRSAPALVPLLVLAASASTRAAPARAAEPAVVDARCVGRAAPPRATDEDRALAARARARRPAGAAATGSSASMAGPTRRSRAPSCSSRAAATPSWR